VKEREGSRRSIVGRGAAANPKNRFERIEVQPDPAETDAEEPRPETVYLRDHSRSIVARNDSPDIGFDASVNPYRGCNHGCAYCYVRPTHEYLGLSAGLDFESKILVKEGAPKLLRKELSSPHWEPKVLSMSGVTDPYQPVERRLGITRRCLEVLAEFRNPVAIVTKNHLVTRDVDLLSELARYDAAAVVVSLTTLDDGLRRATFAAYVPVRLPYAVRPIFEDWLERHYPERKEKVLNRIRSMRGGELNDARFGSRMRGEGLFAWHIAQLFSISCRRAGIGERRFPRLSTAAFCRDGGVQRNLLD
jgi:DNA repair photolyase